MKYIKYSCFAFIALLICGCVSLKKATLYDGVAPVEKVIIPDAKGCTWSGIGIGWDGWAGKDLSLIMSSVAIQMYVRTQKGKAFGLPFVLTLIDYSDGMGFLYTTNKYFERASIDEEWQKVVVPLKDFEITKENLDPTNIKQLQIELQQSGSVYLDDISLVFYEEQEETPWMVEEVLPDPLTVGETVPSLPIKIGFEDYDRAKSFVTLTSAFVEGESYDSKWRKVRIPLSTIPKAIDEDCLSCPDPDCWIIPFPTFCTKFTKIYRRP